MNDKKPAKSNLVKKILVSITLLFDGAIYAGLGYVFLIFMAMLDPVDFDVSTKYANIRQGQVVYLIGLCILLLFLLVAIFWSLTKQVGKYLAAGLSIFSAFILSILVLLLFPLTQMLSIDVVFPLFVLVPVLLGANIFAAWFILSKGSPAVPEKEDNTTPAG